MKRVSHLVSGICAAVFCGVLIGCDWSSSGTSLNTSQGAGVNINFSGVYDGNRAGGKVVGNTSKGSILRLVISQSGNRVQVVDNQGSRYEGSVGSPGVVSQPDSNGAYPAGAELVQAQISFSGKDEVAQRNVQFVGIIHAVAVDDVKGESKETTTSSSKDDTTSSTKDKTASSTTDSASDKSTSKTDNYTYTRTVSTNSTTTTGSSSGATPGTVVTTTDRAYDGNGNLVFQEVTVVTTAPGLPTDVQSTVIVDNRGRTSTQTGSSENNKTSSSADNKTSTSANNKTSETANNTTTKTTKTTRFQITEANTQYRLEGNWIEEGGKSSGVDALSPGTAGVITTTAESTSTAPSPTAQVTFFN